MVRGFFFNHSLVPLVLEGIFPIGVVFKKALQRDQSRLGRPGAGGFGLKLWCGGSAHGNGVLMAEKRGLNLLLGLYKDREKIGLSRILSQNLMTPNFT